MVKGLDADAVLSDPLNIKIMEWLDDFEVHAGDCIRIRDHNTSQVVPLLFNAGQRVLHDVAEKQLFERGFVRIVFLKSRRFGGSTYVEGRFYSKASLNKNKNVFIVGHEEKSTTTLFRMAQLMHEQNPYPPLTLASNAQELRFDTKGGKGLKSEYQLATAKNEMAGRSQGIHYLHVSEEGYWPERAAFLLNGLFSCFPEPPDGTEIFRESTANGCGDTFHEAVIKSYCEGQNVYYTAPLPHNQTIEYPFSYHDPDPESQNEWILVFVPWFVHARYTRPFDSPELKQAFISRVNQPVFDEEELRWVDSEAKKLQEKYGLTWEQLNWREWAIYNKCNGSEDLFKQEYPSDVLEAFLSSGSNCFSKTLCDDIELLCSEPLVIGNVVRAAGEVRVRPNKHGHFRVWERYNSEDSYFITIDTAGGKSDDKDKDPDFSVIDVYNHRTGVQAAQWHGHIDYDMIADMAEMIGDMYGRCRACTELNNHGFTVVADLSRKSYPQFEMKPGQPGWQSNRKTKPQMIDSLREAVRDGALQLRCKETVAEMRTFIEENGKFNAASGNHDDRVTTAAIASQMMTLLPREEGGRDKRGRLPQRGFKNWQLHPGNKAKKWDGSYAEYYG